MKPRAILRIFAACSLLFSAAECRPAVPAGGDSDLTVFAAASLTGAFRALGKKFEAAHPAARVRFNFAGSQLLVQQILHGGKADLFASADLNRMNAAADSGLVDTASARIFARNRLVAVFSNAHPEGVGLRELAKPGVKIVLADSSVPAGRYALAFLQRCSTPGEFGSSFGKAVLGNVVSYEENVRAVLSKVALGECDAGIVYSSDLAPGDSLPVRPVEIPDRLNVIAEYPIALVRGSARASLAREFLDYVCSPEGARVLGQFGFLGVESRVQR